MNNQNFVIAIPTYRRPKILIEKTLKVLKNYNIPNSQIIIFIKDQKELNDYTDIVANYKIILTDASGIMETRNFLQAFFYYETEFTNVLFMDDDIDSLWNMDKPLENFKEFVEFAFMETSRQGLNLWGISALHNPFYMSKKITKTLKYICGAVYGEIFDRTKYPVFADINHYEDHQKSMDCFIRDGGVMKFNWVGIKTKYFGVGGINESMGGMEYRHIEMDNNAIWLAEKYNGMCKVMSKKWGTDLRLNYHYKNKEIEIK